jgi:UV DNA damage endonuclease
MRGPSGRASHPDLRAWDFRRQLDEAADELERLAARARDLGLRLSTHPGQYTVLNARDPAIVELALAEVEQSAALLDRLGAGLEGSVVVHVGGEYGNRTEALDRWALAWDRLSDRARARLGLENDERDGGTARPSAEPFLQVAFRPGRAALSLTCSRWAPRWDSHGRRCPGPTRA